MILEADPATYSICRLEADAPLPEWALAKSSGGGFFSVTRTPDEWSIVCEQALLPHDDSSSVDSPLKVERDWRAFKVRGPLDFQLTGILASLAAPLSQAPAGGIAISLFAISTFDTDYILVKSARFEDAITTWTTAGHEIHRSTQL